MKKIVNYWWCNRLVQAISPDSHQLQLIPTVKEFKQFVKVHKVIQPRLFL